MSVSKRFSAYILAAIIFALPFERIPSLSLIIGGVSVTVRISQVLGLILIALNLPLLWSNRRQLIGSPWRWLLLFNALCILGISMAMEPKRALMVASYTLFVSVIAWTIALLAQTNHLARYQKALYWATGLAAMVALYQFFGDLLGLPAAATGLREIYTKGVFGFPRIQSTALEPLYFADFLLIPLSVALFSYVRTGALRWLITFGGIASLIWLTLSRGAYVALVVIGLLGCVAALWRRDWGNWRNWKSTALILGTGIIAGCVAISMVTLAGRINITHKASSQQAVDTVGSFTKHSTDFQTGESSEGRTVTRNLAFRAFQEHPITGIGVGNFGVYATAHDPLRFPSTTGIVNNEPLEILAETGLVGLSLIMLFALGSLHAAAQAIRTPKLTSVLWSWIAGITAALVGIAIQYQTFSTLYITHIWVAIGLLIGLSLKTHHETPHTRNSKS